MLARVPSVAEERSDSPSGSSVESVICFGIIKHVKEIIWIYGTSAAGKETFIKELATSRELQRLLKLGGTQIGFSEQSLINLGRLDESRASIIQEIAQIIDNNEVVLVKWQYGDTLLGTPEELLHQHPAARHRVIELIVGDDDQRQRLQAKSWWHDTGHEDEFIAQERVLVQNSIKSLPSTFMITGYSW